MTTRLVACLLAAGLPLAAGVGLGSTSPAPPGARPLVEILVGGAPLGQFAHEGRTYIEALKGREYAIRLRNPYGVRVAVALSVDGLNTIDAGQTTAAAARKWVLDPYETVTISGWQTSRADARRFEFTTEEGSYGTALGKTANLGVISAAFFRERPVPVAQSLLGSGRQAPAEPSPAAPRASAETSQKAAADDEFAATGMGRRTSHAVREVWLDLEDTPVRMVDIRYEFRPQLVQLGILRPHSDPLKRRERARGFEPGFSPEPRR